MRVKAKIAGFLIGGLLCASAHGQGTILFSTFIPGAANVDARVAGPDGRGLGSYGGSAQLYLLDGGTYTQLLPATTFRSDTPIPAAAAYVVTPQQAVVVPGIGAGEQATIVLRAWFGAPTWDVAIGKGESAPAIVTLGGIPAGGGAPLPPAFLSSLQGFTILAPEPSATALALVGAAALLLGKRKC